MCLPAIVRLNIKPEAGPGIDPKAHCFREGVAGMGWHVDPDSTTALSWDAYRRLAAATYPDGYWGRPVTTLHDLPNGTVIWTRSGNGDETKFWAGLVIGPWEYRDDPGALAADVVNVRPVIWHRVGGYRDVPEALARRLVSEGIWSLADPEDSTVPPGQDGLGDLDQPLG